MTNIKFGTDGWRAIIAHEFTTSNVARLAEATAIFAKKRTRKASVVIGHDCRFGGELFAETAARVMASLNVKVYLATGFVSTPMVSLAAIKYDTTVGVVITASHNPPLYNGYKLKSHHGGPMLEDGIGEVESLIPDQCSIDTNSISMEQLVREGLLVHADIETIYCNYLEEKFDLAAIRNSSLSFAFDAMYGSGQNAMRRLFPDITLVHCERQPLFDGIPPEPLERNLKAFSLTIRNHGKIDCGLAVDGDADRIALFDHQGNYIDSHHVILLLIHYLYHYKKLTGKVVTGFSSSVKIDSLCKAYKLPLEVVKIGFKHISERMNQQNILVGGEESGGIAVKGHIPERDGIFNGLVIWEALVATGKSLQELISEVYDITGSFAFERADLHMSQTEKERIVKNCQESRYSHFGPYRVMKQEGMDGFKYYFSDSQWFMIRPSGTEPVLRTYAEGHSKQQALNILEEGYKTIMGG